MTLIFSDEFAINPQSAESGGGTKYLEANVTKVGTLTDNKGVLSGFAPQTTYATFPISGINNPFEFKIKIKTPMSFDSSYARNIFRMCYGEEYEKRFGLGVNINDENKLSIIASTNGSSWWSAGELKGNSVLALNTNYYIKIVFNGSTYTVLLSTDDSNYTTEITHNDSALYSGINICNLGISVASDINPYWQGSIDLNGCYLKINNKIVWQGMTELSGGGGGTKQKVLTPNASICGNYCFLEGGCLTQRGSGTNSSDSTMSSGLVLDLSGYNCTFQNDTDMFSMEFDWSPLASGSNDRGIIRLEGNSAHVTFDLYNGSFRCYNTIAGGSTDIINTSISPSASYSYKLKMQIGRKKINWSYKKVGDENYTTIVDKTFSTSQLSSLKVLKLLCSSTYQLLSQVNLDNFKIAFNDEDISLFDYSKVKQYNFLTNGDLINSNGYLTGFKYSTSINNASFKSPDFSSATSFEVVFKFKHDLPEISTSNASIFAGSATGQVLSAPIISSNKVGFAVGNNNATGWQTTEGSTYGTTTLQALTWYWYKIAFTGTQYVGSLSTDGENYTTEWTYNSTMTPSHRDSDIIMIGTNRGATFTQGFNGVIDMNECYIKIDGETVWKGVN